MAANQTGAMSVIGKPRPRVDGPLKVTGRALYASDNQLSGALYAVPICATIASGTIQSIEATAAEKMPGVRAIFHRQNIGKIFRSTPESSFAEHMSHVDENRPAFEDDIVRYWGQYVALAVADTFEQAKAAADAVEVTYQRAKPNVSPHLKREEPAPPKTSEPGQVPDVEAQSAAASIESERGDAEKAFAEAPVKIDYTYHLPVETHNPIELHATVAEWDGPNVTFYEATQGVVNHRNVLAQMLGIPSENVRVVSKFLGSGFGGKLFPWSHCALAAVAARNLKQPVKLVLSRPMMFYTVGHRPRIEQRIRIGATPEGKLLSFQHDYINHTSMLDDYKENCGEATPMMFSVPNLRVTSSLARRNVGTPTSMRGPGAVPGMFATESAMDELAIALKMDPVKLRLLNEPEIDESTKLPFSSRHIKECFEIGAEKFGWSNRTPEVGSMKRDGLTIGWGTAGCSWIAARFSFNATVELRDDGTACVSSATQDIGTGTYTVMAQVASERLGLPVEKVEVNLGDTRLPSGPISGGSMVTASAVPAIIEAADAAVESLLSIAVKIPQPEFNGRKPSELQYTKGRVHLKKASPDNGVPYHEILATANTRFATGRGSSNGTFGSKDSKFSSHSFGAHFIEVTWQPETARLRVSRVVTVIDAGRIINPLAGRNQIEGAVVMGIGMALFEETNYDQRYGAPINASLADYIVATNADVPKLDVQFLDYPDLNLNEYGARGIGEIGLAGTAAAIAGAVYHATGYRGRELPIKIEHLLG
jgi:xanthine dehydrogenase YagR molybdenum-binding subunit